MKTIMHYLVVGISNHECIEREEVMWAVNKPFFSSMLQKVKNSIEIFPSKFNHINKHISEHGFSRSWTSLTNDQHNTHVYDLRGESSFLNINDDSNIIFAHVWTRNSRWYSSKMSSSMFQSPLVLIKLFRTDARSRSSQCWSPCLRGWVRLRSSGHHSMYSSIDLAF